MKKKKYNGTSGQMNWTQRRERGELTSHTHLLWKEKGPTVTLPLNCHWNSLVSWVTICMWKESQGQVWLNSSGPFSLSLTHSLSLSLTHSSFFLQVNWIQTKGDIAIHPLDPPVFSRTFCEVYSWRECPLQLLPWAGQVTLPDFLDTESSKQPASHFVVTKKGQRGEVEKKKNLWNTLLLVYVS